MVQHDEDNQRSAQVIDEEQAGSLPACAGGPPVLWISPCNLDFIAPKAYLICIAISIPTAQSSLSQKFDEENRETILFVFLFLN